MLAHAGGTVCGFSCSVSPLSVVDDCDLAFRSPFFCLPRARDAGVPYTMAMILSAVLSLGGSFLSSSV